MLKKTELWIMLQSFEISIGFVFLASRKFDNPKGLSNSGLRQELSDFHDDKEKEIEVHA